MGERIPVVPWNPEEEAEKENDDSTWYQLVNVDW